MNTTITVATRGGSEVVGLSCSICCKAMSADCAGDAPALLRPCNHALCLTCAVKVKGSPGICPMCKRRIDAIEHLYCM